MGFLLKNSTVMNLDLPKLSAIDIRITDGRITDNGKSMRPRKNDEVIDLSGKYIIPGFVNSHTHLYSALSRGMPSPKNAPRELHRDSSKSVVEIGRSTG